jgi:hypothetical protein
MAARAPATFDQSHTEWVAWEAVVAASNAVPPPDPSG